MSSCKARGKLKRRHLTRHDAENHQKRHQHTTNIRVDVYRCPDCKYWHVGRHKTTKAEKFFTSTYAEKRDEILVGKLIAALKQILTSKVNTKLRKES